MLKPSFLLAIVFYSFQQGPNTSALPVGGVFRDDKGMTLFNVEVGDRSDVSVNWLTAAYSQKQTAASVIPNDIPVASKRDTTSKPQLASGLN